jgi:triacylglycerol lipase
MKRRLTAFASMAAVLLGIGAATPASSLAQDPILFVHGWSESATLWNTMIGRFEKDGYPKSYLSAYSYNTSQSNKVDAEKEVKSHVESLLKTTGATKVDIIAHSMGSLNTRWYIKFLGGEPTVDDWVSLGGPNHGTETANGCTPDRLRRDAGRLDFPLGIECRRRDPRRRQLRHLVVALRRNHQSR